MNKLLSQEPPRRALLKRTAALSVLTITGIAGFTAPSVAFAAAMTKEQRDKMTPDDIIVRALLNKSDLDKSASRH